MNFQLSEEMEAYRRMAREFALKEIEPFVASDDEEQFFRREVIKKMGALGLLGCIIPEEYGGSEAGYLPLALIVEEIGKVSTAMTIPFNTQAVGPPYAILRWGTEEQKKKYLTDLIKGEIISCFAITEPDSGSDIASMKSKAKRDGDYYILNGNKTWITFSPVADIALVYVYTDESKKHHGMSCFIVEKDAVGYSTNPIKSKLGLRSMPTGEIILQDCRVPKENLLGKEGEGFKICMAQLEGTRLCVAARGVGLASACLQTAKDYAKQRIQFGQAIANFQMIQEQLALMAVEEEAARLLVYKAAWSIDNFPDKRHTKEVAFAKYFAAETAVKASNEAVKILGAYGYSEEYPVARYLRDAKAMQIVEGSSNIQKTLIARTILD